MSLFECLKPKFTKEKKVKIKTKDLTRVIVTDGKFLVNAGTPTDNEIDAEPSVDEEISDNPNY